MIGYERDVEQDCEPLPGKQEENIDGNMDDVFWQNQRIETVALIYWVLVVGFKLIESNNLKKN